MSRLPPGSTPSPIQSPAAVDRMLSMGATEHDPITPRESGFVTASVVDPFGNILGVMVNPHYLEILQARPAR